jgi:hypothetical protein
MGRLGRLARWGWGWGWGWGWDWAGVGSGSSRRFNEPSPERREETELSLCDPCLYPASERASELEHATFEQLHHE